MDILHYKGYEGTADIDTQRLVCRGKILFIRDLIIYEASNPKDLRKAFENAVEEYLETCKEVGKAPQKPLRGVFNVRIAPELHKDATIRAKKDGISLNELVARAIDAFVHIRADVNHNVQVTINAPDSMKTVFSSSAVGQNNWERFSNVQH